MFGFLKKSAENKTQAENEYDLQAQAISQKISEMESALNKNPRDGETQKQLMLEYNRALTIFAKSRGWRNEIDPLFVKIDDLRNTIRKNI